MSLSLEGHTARAFDGDLSSLHVQAVAMGALVIDQVQLAVNAYSGWDRSMATLVLERERKINLYDAEIEEAALQVIAQAPAGGAGPARRVRHRQGGHRARARRRRSQETGAGRARGQRIERISSRARPPRARRGSWAASRCS